MSTTAMLLAGQGNGQGTGQDAAMRTLTGRTALPLLPLGGRTLIDHALDRLAEAGVARVVVAAHRHADQLGAHLRARSGPPPTELRHARGDADGAAMVRGALGDGRLGPSPFFVVNGEAFWLDGPEPALGRLLATFDEKRMDGLLLVHRACQVMGEIGLGDVMLDKSGLVRRRAEREVADAKLYGITNFARDVLTVADDFERALGSVDAQARASAEGTLKTLLDGIDLTARALTQTLTKHGVARIEAEGAKFDPNLHQAMFEVPNPDVPSGTVVQVVQPGYTIGGRVLRPALVGVAKGGPKAAPDAPADKTDAA
jgi:hypothetical protein